MFKYEAGWVVATRSQLRFTEIIYRITCLYPAALFTLIESEMRIGAGESRPCFHYEYGSPGPMQTCRREVTVNVSSPVWLTPIFSKYKHPSTGYIHLNF